MLDLNIKGKQAIVCGSSRGLGRACATSLARAGVSVVINGRTASSVSAAAKEIATATGGDIRAVAADVTTRTGQAELMRACPAPDILVTNAGGPAFRDFRELDRQAMLDGLQANMITAIELIQQCVDGMIERRFGRIVNITSFTAKMPVAGLDLSSGARAGLISFVAGIARDVAHANVTINNMLPGFFQTDRFQQGVQAWAEQQGVSTQSILTSRAQQVPAKRIGDPAEFGDACAFLCSRSAGYITGQNWLLDGGLYPSAF